MRIFPLSADPPPADPPPADPQPVREVLTSAYAQELSAKLATTRAELATAQRTIESMGRQQAGDKRTIAQLNNDIADLNSRNVQLSQRLHAARPITPAPAGAGRPGQGDAGELARLRAQVRQLTDGNNAQANIIAHQQAALAGRAPVHLGGWQ